jgi:hypothetical protein
MGSILAKASILLPFIAVCVAQNTTQKPASVTNRGDNVSVAVGKAARWLVSVQGADGGWGQDGGGTSTIRAGERLETNGNDVANTAVAALALLEAGPEYRTNVERAVKFILRKVEASPVEGLAITDLQGTQIQRKLGPYIDTFLTSMLLAKVDGALSSPALNAEARRALQKSVAKIVTHQAQDGSWNTAGGWAPILGTSMASRSLYAARMAGVEVNQLAMDRVSDFSAAALAPPAAPTSGAAGGVGVGAGATVGTVLSATTASAGVPLYQSAQALEQLSRTEEDRKKNAKEIAAIQSQLKDAAFVQGFGSMGGEEFFSYLNISDSLKRTGGKAWEEWDAQITKKILDLQNGDGTWAGHHCITGRVAVTSAAILNLMNRAH